MKKLNTKGFTLAELLIVVAIIAVLVAISIPVFNSQLEKSREETDTANLRAAKAVAIVGMLDGNVDVDGTLTKIDATHKDFFYDINKGTLVSTNPKGYGKGTALDGKCETFIMSSGSGGTNYTGATNVKDKVIKVAFTLDANAVSAWTLSWEDSTAT